MTVSWNTRRPRRRRSYKRVHYARPFARLRGTLRGASFHLPARMWAVRRRTRLQTRLVSRSGRATAHQAPGLKSGAREAIKRSEWGTHMQREGGSDKPLTRASRRWEGGRLTEELWHAEGAERRPTPPSMSWPHRGPRHASGTRSTRREQRPHTARRR